ncbi:MAG: hypothetical protein JWO13_3070 [Acidobacteriales bacterium]|nr:hypothetical protein [Terriglobales bacterium]
MTAPLCSTIADSTGEVQPTRRTLAAWERVVWSIKLTRALKDGMVAEVPALNAPPVHLEESFRALQAKVAQLEIGKLIKTTDVAFFIRTRAEKGGEEWIGTASSFGNLIDQLASCAPLSKNTSIVLGSGNRNKQSFR